jgi:hypothetical protein
VDPLSPVEWFVSEREGRGKGEGERLEETIFLVKREKGGGG